jgi:hypothetical protein
MGNGVGGVRHFIDGDLCGPDHLASRAPAKATIEAEDWLEAELAREARLFGGCSFSDAVVFEAQAFVMGSEVTNS